jgi:repressor LexA
MLTKKQHQLLLLINHRLADDGVPPSFEEMKLALGLRSKSGVHRLITGLEERGFIRRIPHRARALEVLRLPKPAPEAGGFKPNVIQGGKDAPATGTAPIEIPLYGRIAAGLPIEALTDPSVYVPIPPDMLGSGDHYALEIAGDSMIQAGIMDGDTVVIRKADRADNGQIVVALVGGDQVTLKRWRLRGDKVALEPCNPEHETRIFSRRSGAGAGAAGRLAPPLRLIHLTPGAAACP